MAFAELKISDATLIAEAIAGADQEDGLLQHMLCVRLTAEKGELRRRNGQRRGMKLEESLRQALSPEEPAAPPDGSGRWDTWFDLHGGTYTQIRSGGTLEEFRIGLLESLGLSYVAVYDLARPNLRSWKPRTPFGLS